LATAVLCGALLAPASAAAEGIELKLAHFVPPMHVQHQESFLPFAQNVEKLSQGRVRIKVFAGGALGGPLQLPDAVKTGVVDMAFIVPSYSTGRFPRSSVLDLPFLSDQAVKGARIFYDLYDSQLAADYRDYKVLWLYSSDPGQLFTVTGPVRGLADLRGKKIRSPSAIMSDALRLLGAHPVSMPISELHSALDKKVIDGMLSPTTGIHDFKLYDQIRHTTRLNLFNSLLMVVMNQERFASLPAEAKKALEEASGKDWGLRASGIYDRLDAEVMARLRAAGKVSLDTLAPGEKEQFQARLHPLESDWVARQTAQKLPAAEIVRALHGAVKGHP
jgi:TRAP-type C4-dicarboxylate transport system substrate-binding protein